MNRFAQMLGEIVEFCDAQKRLPKNKSKNERRLARWIAHQMSPRNAERERLFKEAHPLLAERLRQWNAPKRNFK